MGRYISHRRSRRKVPTICPRSRATRRRAQVCDDTQCTPYTATATAWEESPTIEIMRTTPDSWPESVITAEISATINGAPVTIESVNLPDQQTFFVTLGTPIDLGDTWSLTIGGSNGECPTLYTGTMDG